MRVQLLPADALGNNQPFPYSVGRRHRLGERGWEFEVIWAPTDRLDVERGLGLIDTNYIQAGILTGATGPGEHHGQLPAARRSRMRPRKAARSAPIRDPARRTAAASCSSGNYGYTGDYARDAAYQRTQIDASGKPVLEPGVRHLERALRLRAGGRATTAIEVWGKNLLDELYINGGFDTRDIWGYDFSIVGRSRRKASA